MREQVLQLMRTQVYGHMVRMRSYNQREQHGIRIGIMLQQLMMVKRHIFL